MSKISRDEIAATAKLARLALSDPQLAELQSDFETILEHMDILQTINTDGVEPMTHAYEIPLRLRGDDVEPSLETDLALAQAPSRQDDFFVVPAIIGEEL